MSRLACLAILSAGLMASSGCSSCFGGSGCRRPSFLEFRSPCGSAPTMAPMQPCGPSYAPACEPACAPAAPCCDGAAPMTAGPVTVG